MSINMNIHACSKTIEWWDPSTFCRTRLFAIALTIHWRISARVSSFKNRGSRRDRAFSVSLRGPPTLSSLLSRLSSLLKLPCISIELCRTMATQRILCQRAKESVRYKNHNFWPFLVRIKAVFSRPMAYESVRLWKDTKNANLISQRWHLQML